VGQGKLRGNKGKQGEVIDVFLSKIAVAYNIKEAMILVINYWFLL
jgi:hypothetical protein